MKTFLVTGGAGFIGSNFILNFRRAGRARIVNLDKLTYAGNLHNLAELRDDADYRFVRGDIGDAGLVREILNEYRPDAVVNFAAESHVDRSILEPAAFIQTNVVGTFTLLETVWEHFKSLKPADRGNFRFLHVSTDEVFGSLGPDDPAFSETSPYAPNSPYAASKAAGDHLARSYFHTFGLPLLITHASNNYGPRQFPEKLIPLTILNAVGGLNLPIYGDGLNVRDWLFVEDHIAALGHVLEKGRIGETYNIGGDCERTNIDVVQAICRILDKLFPDSPRAPHERLISFVKDRPGHDRRYAIDGSKVARETGWRPGAVFEDRLAMTVRWYLDHPDWVRSIQTGEYRRWIDLNYADRDRPL